MNLREKTKRKMKKIKELEETIDNLTEKNKSLTRYRWARTILPQKLPAVAWGSENDW